MGLREEEYLKKIGKGIDDFEFRKMVVRIVPRILLRPAKTTIIIKWKKKIKLTSTTRVESLPS